MNTNENINELMVAIEEVLGVKIDWTEENGDIKIDRANLTPIVEGLEQLRDSNVLLKRILGVGGNADVRKWKR